MSADDFEAKFGGTVASFLPLDPDFAANLVQLGFNSPVTGLIGNPDDLYEEHVHAALQFVVNGRVVRYGQKFRGVVLPDGVAIVSGQSLFLYDAKAYRDGYPVSRDSIRQFADYVRRFHGSHESTLGRLSGFLLVSSSFDVPPGHHQARSTELFAECGVPLVFVTSGVLGAICAECARRPELRRHVRWREVIVPPDLDLERFRSAVQMLDREGLT
jgi:hypothetical protein